MAYTDLWRCKRCQTLPDITFLSGKRFLIECKVCRTKSTSVECSSLDEVVRRWNEKNDPKRFRIGEKVKEFFEMISGFFDYRREKRLERQEIARRHAEELAKPAPVPTSAAMRAAEEGGEVADEAPSEGPAEGR